MGRIYVTKTEESTKDDEILSNVWQHKYDVSIVMNELAKMMIDIGVNHDWTKLKYFNQFVKDTVERKDTADFKKRDWYKIHTSNERHHVNAKIPTDVNLFDLIEMQVDCIVAGKTRNDGKVDDNFLIVPQSVINEAYWNTVKMLKSMIVVK